MVPLLLTGARAARWRWRASTSLDGSSNFCVPTALFTTQFFPSSEQGKLWTVNSPDDWMKIMSLEPTATTHDWQMWSMTYQVWPKQLHLRFQASSFQLPSACNPFLPCTWNAIVDEFQNVMAQRPSCRTSLKPYQYCPQELLRERFNEEVVWVWGNHIKAKNETIRFSAQH